MDLLNWQLWIKWLVLVQVSLVSFLSLLCASLITPAYVPLSLFLHKTVVETAYVIKTFIAAIGVSPLFWNPISNISGRRPIYIMSLAASIITSACSGASRSYGELLAFRAIQGFFVGVPQGLGSVSVCDLFFEHERGFYMGIFTVSLITGGHIAPIIGGYIEKNLSWHWCFYVPAILAAALLVLFIATVPETLFSRSPESLERPSRTWTQNMTMRGKIHPTRKLQAVDFVRPLQLLRYPCILLPTLYYAVSFTYGSILFIITSANIFAKIYHFKPFQAGLLLGIPLTVGSLVGELFSGGLSDFLSNRRALARGGARKPEDRLIALLPAFVLTPIGIIIEGLCIQRKSHFVATGFEIGIASVGLQIATTVIYTYTAECYKPQAAEIGGIMNFGRQMFAFCVGFYAVQLGTEIGFRDAWLTFAMIDVFFIIPLVVLYFKGETWRKRLGPVSFHSDS